MSGFETENYMLYQEGRAAMESRDYDLAIKKFEKSAELAPHFKTLESLGECFLEQKNYSRAIICFAAAAGLGNNQFRAYYLLAKALLAFGDQNKAVDKLNEALKMNPNYKAAQNLVTEILKETEQ